MAGNVTTSNIASTTMIPVLCLEDSSNDTNDGMRSTISHPLIETAKEALNGGQTEEDDEAGPSCSNPSVFDKVNPFNI